MGGRGAVLIAPTCRMTGNEDILRQHLANGWYELSERLRLKLALPLNVLRVVSPYLLVTVRQAWADVPRVPCAFVLFPFGKAGISRTLWKSAPTLSAKWYRHR
jgi:hypothetical protein